MQEEPEQDPIMTRHVSQNSLQKALEAVRQCVIDGLRHGHFKCTVTVETMNNQNRRLTIGAGKSYRFYIAASDLSDIRTQRGDS